jgi:hypothetical protein
VADATQDTTQHDSPPQTHNQTGWGYCSWHQRFAADVRLINVIEQGSGPGDAHYACPDCRNLHGLTLFADQP